MTHEQLVAQLATQAKITPEEAEKFLTELVTLFSEYFRKGEKVVIAEFGSFFVQPDQTIQFNPSAKLKQLIG